MRKVYQGFAFLIAAFVPLQAAFIAFGLFSLGKFVDDGGTLAKSGDEFTKFDGDWAFMAHGIIGMNLVPLVAIVFLIVSFFTRGVPGAAKWAGIVFGLVVLQIFLGLFGHESAWIGFLHPINGFVLFSVAAMTGVRAARPSIAKDMTDAVAARV